MGFIVAWFSVHEESLVDDMLLYVRQRTASERIALVQAFSSQLRFNATLAKVGWFDR